jgi:hypothetical protein
MIERHEIDEALLTGALTIKELAGQIHVVIHAVGIPVALPQVLERDERIESARSAQATPDANTTWRPIGRSPSSSSSSGEGARNRSAKTVSSSTCSTSRPQRRRSAATCSLSAASTLTDSSRTTGRYQAS